MVTLCAFLDESIGPQCMAVGGWIADSEKWTRFRSSWSRRLKREGVQVLGSSDICAGKSAPFRDWSDEKLEAILRECVEDIGEGVAACVGVSVVFEDFYDALREVGVEVAEQTHRDQNCYALCVIGCVASIAELVQRIGATERHVLITTESGMKGSGKVERYFRHVQEREPDSRGVTLVTPPKSKRTVIELQSADFYARAFMQHTAEIAASATGTLPMPHGLHNNLLVRAFAGTGEHGENALGGYWDREQILLRLRGMLARDADSRFNRELLAGYTAGDDN